jgi:hypothetical protein
MTLAFEYYLNPDYSFNTDFQKQLAEYLSAEYMEYINAQNLTVEEAKVGFDLNGDGDTSDTVALTIEYDENGYLRWLFQPPPQWAYPVGSTVARGSWLG